ncbi:MAG: hypothetical protein OIF47_08170 [Marinibacterium sp.]|nr:hypothetical protein [Marinibacterium sp.]
MRLVPLLLIMCLAACGRPLTETEVRFARQIHGAALDTDRVRLARGALVGSVTLRRDPRPRTSCRQKILPPVTKNYITVSPAAVALFNRIHFAQKWYLEDYTPDYPERLDLVQAMLLAHELTHVWQWQQRKTTGYHPFKAVQEHGQSGDPYLFDLSSDADFLSFGYEQQGTIVEEYVCCRTLAPTAARTQRLHDMLAGAFPVSDLPRTREGAVGLPWDGVELDGICD